jgi:hypothetical protein
MLVPVIWSEIMAWLDPTPCHEAVIGHILPQFEMIQGRLNTVVTKQVEALKANNATQQNLREVERELNELSLTIVRAMVEINRKSLDIICNLAFWRAGAARVRQKHR